MFYDKVNLEGRDRFFRLRMIHLAVRHLLHVELFLEAGHEGVLHGLGAVFVDDKHLAPGTGGGGEGVHQRTTQAFLIHAIRAQHVLEGWIESTQLFCVSPMQGSHDRCPEVFLARREIGRSCRPWGTVRQVPVHVVLEQFQDLGAIREHHVASKCAHGESSKSHPSPQLEDSLASRLAGHELASSRGLLLHVLGPHDGSVPHGGAQIHGVRVLLQIEKASQCFHLDVIGEVRVPTLHPAADGADPGLSTTRWRPSNVTRNPTRPNTLDRPRVPSPAPIRARPEQAKPSVRRASAAQADVLPAP
eukprot:scaffold2636_cov340-Pavlova_lutheri.AAC.68